MRIMVGWLFGSLLVGTFLLGVALVLNAPLLVAAHLARTRLPRLLPKATLAAGFALAAAYMLYRMEWFDVWRHGVPPARYVLRAYLPWIAALAAAGWAAGGIAVREKPLRPRRIDMS